MPFVHPDIQAIIAHHLVVQLDGPLQERLAELARRLASRLVVVFCSPCIGTTQYEAQKTKKAGTFQQVVDEIVLVVWRRSADDLARHHPQLAPSVLERKKRR